MASEFYYISNYFVTKDRVASKLRAHGEIEILLKAGP